MSNSLSVNMNGWQEYPAASIGAIAHALWPYVDSATIIGVTSRGVLLRAAPDRVLFLSYESRHGPLTITVPSSVRELFAEPSPAIGTKVLFSANRLIFPTIELAISISDEVVWQTPRPAAPMLSPVFIAAIIHSIAGALPAQRRAQGFGPLLVPLLDNASPSNEQAALHYRLASLGALCAQRSSQAAEGAIELLGYGRGLTPSGDDVVVGLLLLLNRFRMNSRAGNEDLLQHGHWLTEFNWQIIHAAYQRTTTLSANLIECAAAGEADERLIALADGIMTGEPPVAQCVDCVLDWGNSSGIDALIGMALAATMY